MNERTELIEDEDGAPYPHCQHCPDQVLWRDTYERWVHVFARADDGNARWYLYSCQRPTSGRYGDFMATPPTEITRG